jgi:hypothetical protein
MNYGQKIVACAVLACVSTWGLFAFAYAANPLFEQYPELFGNKAKPTIVSFGAKW